MTPAVHKKLERRCFLLKSFIMTPNNRMDRLLTCCLQRDPTDTEKMRFYLSPGEIFAKEYWPTIKTDFCKRRQVEICLERYLLPLLGTNGSTVTKKAFLSEPSAYLDKLLFQRKKELAHLGKKLGLPEYYWSC